jgi:hypothetical protein
VDAAPIAPADLGLIVAKLPLKQGLDLAHIAPSPDGASVAVCINDPFPPPPDVPCWVHAMDKRAKRSFVAVLHRATREVVSFEYDAFVKGCAWARPDRLLVQAGYPFREWVPLVDPNTGAVIRAGLGAEDGKNQHLVAVSADGRRALIGLHPDGEYEPSQPFCGVAVCDIETGERIGASPKGERLEILGARFVDDGIELALFALDRPSPRVEVWDVDLSLRKSATADAPRSDPQEPASEDGGPGLGGGRFLVDGASIRVERRTAPGEALAGEDLVRACSAATASIVVAFPWPEVGARLVERALEIVRPGLAWMHIGFGWPGARPMRNPFPFDGEQAGALVRRALTVQDFASGPMSVMFRGGRKDDASFSTALFVTKNMVRVSFPPARLDDPDAFIELSRRLVGDAVFIEGSAGYRFDLPLLESEFDLEADRATAEGIGAVMRAHKGVDAHGSFNWLTFVSTTPPPDEEDYARAHRERLALVPAEVIAKKLPRMMGELRAGSAEKKSFLAARERLKRAAKKPLGMHELPNGFIVQAGPAPRGVGRGDDLGDYRRAFELLTSAGGLDYRGNPDAEIGYWSWFLSDKELDKKARAIIARAQAEEGGEPR